MKKLFAVLGVVVCVTAAVVSLGAASDDRFVLVHVADVDGDGVISHGDVIGFEVAENVWWNQYQMACYQDANQDGEFSADELVASAFRAPWFEGPIELRSRTWESGAASCVANLERFQGGSDKFRVIASVSFEVQE